LISRRKIFVGLGIVVGLALIFYVMAHSRTDGALEAYKRELRAKGEKLTIAELTPPTPTNGPNAAPALMNLAGQLRLNDSNRVPVATLMSPGHLRVAWQQEILPTEDKTNVWPQLAAELENMREALSQARAALTDPVLSFQLNYQLGFNLPLSHLGVLRRTSGCLSFATILALHQNHPDEAWEELKAGVNLARLFGHDEPLEISQSFRASFAQMALSTTWEALQYREWSDKQWTELQAAWDSFQVFDDLEPELAMERDMLPMIFDAVRNSFTNFQSFTSDAYGQGQDGFLHIFNNWAWKTHWSYDEELFYTQARQAGLEAVRSGRTNQAFAPALKQLDETLVRLEVAHTNALAHFMLIGIYPIIPDIVRKVTDMELQRRLLVTAIALKRYQLRNGKYPDQLSALVPDFLLAIPIDIMDGKPLRYRTNLDGTFLLYSVGEDGEDNGGNPTPTADLNRGSGTNRTNRTNRWWLARDAVWPMPATPEEIKAYEDNLIAERKSKEAREQSMSSFGRPPPPSDLKTN
jgi:hypothetical protein